MLTLSERLRHTGEPVKGSRFITTVAPVANEADAHDLVASVRAEMPDASHHCTAWRIASPVIDRANDDGEPGGSAGRPILAQLQGRDLVHSAVVVTRYFGGTKLGVGGLVRAYGSAAGAALDAAVTRPWLETTTVSFSHPYSMTDAIDRALVDVAATPLASTFGEAVFRSVGIAVENVRSLERALADLSAGLVILDAN